MKPLLFAASFLLLVSCKHHQHSAGQNNQPVTPKAMQERAGNVVVSDVSDIRGEDVIQQLYAEQLEKEPVLKALEEEIKRLRDSKDDSLAAYERFSKNNENYFRQAERYAETVKDSVFRTRLLDMLKESRNAYQNLVKQQEDLKAQIEAKDLELQNVHTELVLASTALLMLQYQIHPPSDTSMRNLLKQYQHTLDEANRIKIK